MKTELEQLANKCLGLPQKVQVYDEKDLLNASLIFIHVLTDLAFNHLNTLPLKKEGKEILMQEFGENIRQTILLATGIDMHYVMK